MTKYLSTNGFRRPGLVGSSLKSKLQKLLEGTFHFSYHIVYECVRFSFSQKRIIQMYLVPRFW